MTTAIYVCGWPWWRWVFADVIREAKKTVTVDVFVDDCAGGQQ